MRSIPVISHKAANEELVAGLFARLVDGLVEEEGVADGGVDYPI